MPEYVYALHDFAPEHEDEIAFSAGDRIEVIEKDDMYGDGWWQGRNLFGKVGLFPQSYTTSDPSVLQPQSSPQVNGTDIVDAAPAVPLQSLSEEAEVSSIASGNIKKSEEGADADAEINGKANDDGVMKATMTDVQEAIEQLGRNDRDRDGGNSFSFASTRDGDTTDRELDTDRETDSEAWHKGARSNLAEKARQQQKLLHQEQAAYDAEMQAHTPIMVAHLSEPPIDFEMSDESEGEGEEEHGHTHGLAADTPYPRRDHAHISEEEEDDEDAEKLQANGHSATPQAVSHVSEPLPSENLIPESENVEIQAPRTAHQISFPTKVEAEVETTEASSATKKPHPDSIASTIQVQKPFHLLPAPLLTPTSPTSFSTAQQKPNGYTTSKSPVQPTSETELNGVGSPHSLPSPPTSQNGTLSSQPKLPMSPPSEWSVVEVVEWAKSKGFDNSVCDKFIEHEISGDVLLELDSNILKTELEIHAFGKRTRIAKEIAELRRPPSVLSSAPPAHSRTISQSISLPSSAHHSLSSPMAAMISPESPPHTGDLAASSSGSDALRRDSDPGSSLRNSEPEQESTTVNNSMLGLGLVAATSVVSSTIGSMEKLDMPKGKNRPAYLNLSPSDNSLNSRARSAKFSPKSTVDEAMREERAALSDTDSAHALDNRSRRRRIFGRSAGSTHSDQKDSASRNSKEAVRDATTPVSLSTSMPGSPSMKRGSTDDGSVKTHQRRKRSVDAAKSSDRLSLFGGSISIGRARKPPPRVQSYAHDDMSAEKHPRSLSRLYLSSGNRKTSAKSTMSGSETMRRSETDDREATSPTPSVLRKRTTSIADAPALPGLVGGLKAGQSVLEQIGTPDHNGWMRKKGEHYNTWKMRYFVLKGPHLYYLKTSSTTETRIKGYINIIGYKVVVDENINPGKYGFRLIHELEKTHFFSSDESITVREWMKALMKATIGRDYTKPVISSCNIPTIPLSVAQTMNPAPRPPSPTQRDATQKALRRENPNQLSTRDARVLMGLPSSAQNGGSPETSGKTRADDSFFTLESLPEARESMPVTPSTVNAIPAARTNASAPPPVRPSREMRRTSVPPIDSPNAPADLIHWANDYLPQNLRIPETGGQIYSGLALYRLAEAIKGKPTEPAVPDSAFPTGPNDDRLDGLFKLFDFFLDNDVRMGSVSINDVRQGRKDKIVHLLRSLKAWEEKRHAIARSLGRTGAQAGPFMGMESSAASAVHAW